MNVRYLVQLTPEERDHLEALCRGGTHRPRLVKRAQALLAVDARRCDEDVAHTLRMGLSTLYRLKRRFVEEGLDHALHDRQRPGARRKLSSKEEALLVATTCSAPPAGRARWTLQLLADELVQLTAHESLSRETVRRRLEEKVLKPWQKRMWCIPEVDSEFVARMEDVLELYEEEPDSLRPVVCFDESPVQLVSETRLPLPASCGKTARYDYEYKRNGTANLFVFLDAHRPWRHVKVTDQRTSKDFADCMRDLAEVHFSKAEKIRVVLDNLSTHHPGALYERFPPEQARQILRRLEFHFVPKHASWLNMVEIEIGVLSKQCLDRRIGDKVTLSREIAAWQQERNAAEARVRWLFGVERAREKLGRSYPPIALAPSDALTKAA